jgi:glycosyltransferase involved in cell wall biosynthesis
VFTSKAPLRIAFVVDCLDGQGGGFVSARRFIKELRREHEVRVIGTGPDGPDHVSMPPLRLPSRTLEEMRFVFARPIRARIAQAMQDADIVHLQLPFWLSFVARDEARKLGKPIVAAMHVQPENFLRNMGLRSASLASAAYRFWVSNYYNLVDTVVCPTRFAEEQLRAHGLETPVLVVSNGFSPDFQSRTYPREPQHEGFFLILAVGRLAAEKRQDVLLHAVAASRHRHEIKVVLAGTGPRDSSLKQLGVRLGVDLEVTYASSARLERLMNTADLFVHCSEVELEGMSVLDAMNVGLPALIAQSAQSAASQFALDERFSFPAGNADSLRDRLDWLIENPQWRTTAPSAAKALARRFDFADNAAALAGLFRSLVERSEGLDRTPRTENARAAG